MVAQGARDLFDSPRGERSIGPDQAPGFRILCSARRDFGGLISHDAPSCAMRRKGEASGMPGAFTSLVGPVSGHCIARTTSATRRTLQHCPGTAGNLAAPSYASHGDWRIPRKSVHAFARGSILL